MAGRRNIYEKHLKAGHDYAWDGRWDKAVEQYRLALAEFPEEPPALVALAQAYRELGKRTEAAQVYRTLAKVSPRDPVPLIHLAQLEAEQGHVAQAVDACMALADLHRDAGDIRQAVAAWEQAIRLAPDHIAARQRLAAAYAQLRAVDRAVEQHLALAGILQRMGQVEKAIQQCREALRLAPANLAARNMMEMLREGAEAERPAPAAPQEAPTAEVLTPAAETQRKALTELAGALFEEKAAPAQPQGEPTAQAADRATVDTLISQAIDFQTRGLVDEAISSYLRLLKMGEDRPAIHFNLGLLFQQQLRFEDAIEHLLRSVKDPEYRLGSHFALGQCYRAQGQVGLSIEHFLEVLKIVDLETVGRDQADDLIQLYENLAESYQAQGDADKARSFADSLVQFLSGKGWQDKVREARKRLGGAGEGVTVSMAELLEAEESDEILRALSLGQEYLKRGLLAAAADECHRAVGLASDYLPAHMKLADVWLQMGDIPRAADKYRLVADLYALRGDEKRAVAVYRRLLQINAADTDARATCIKLLVKQGEYEAALEEYITQIQMLARVAQVDQALALAQEAQALIREYNLAPRWQAAVLHQVAEIQVGRVQWKAALDTYRQIIALSPTDERARIRLVDLHFKLGRDAEALAQLNELIALYRERGDHNRMIRVVRELADLRPDNADLHRLLAQAYQAAGRMAEAVQELDLASRLLWDEGQQDGAREALRELIALNPPNVETYRARLQQMGG
ncbi:MAG: tetratricopeptide repeat protein [Anaerolineae bacterium]|nr:tetratricopeptide repeat protein [Anaerolineae bacterium]